MGFTEYEKLVLKKLIRSNEKTVFLQETELEQDIFNFLKSERLLKQAGDYGIFPSKYKTIVQAENIVISKFFDSNLNIVEILENLAKNISGPYSLQIDCSLIIKHEKTVSKKENIFKNHIILEKDEFEPDDLDIDVLPYDEIFSSTNFEITEAMKEINLPELKSNVEIQYRYVWAQRNLAFNNVQRIETQKSMDDLIKEVKGLEYSDLMRKVYEIHQSQSCFDKSGFRPVRLLSTVLFLTKY